MFIRIVYSNYKNCNITHKKKQKKKNAWHDYFYIDSWKYYTVRVK